MLTEAQLFCQPFNFRDAAAESRDHGFDLIVEQYLLQRGLLHIQYLATQGKDRLGLAVTRGLDRTACRITLYYIYLALFRVLRGACRKL